MLPIDEKWVTSHSTVLHSTTVHTYNAYKVVQHESICVTNQSPSREPTTLCHVPHSIIINIILIILHQIVIGKRRSGKKTMRAIYCCILCHSATNKQTNQLANQLLKREKNWYDQQLILLRCDRWHTKVKIVCLANEHMQKCWIKKR